MPMQRRQRPPTLRRRRRANRRDRRRQRELEEIDDGARLVRQQRVDEAGAPTKHRRRRIDSEKLAGGFDNGRRVQIELSRPRNRVRQRRSIRQQRVAERFRAVAQVGDRGRRRREQHREHRSHRRFGVVAVAPFCFKSDSSR